MIIRFGVKDNDFTEIIKPFYKEIKFNNEAWYKNINKDNQEELEQALTSIKDYEMLFEKCLYNKKEMNQNEIDKLNRLLRCKFDYFLKQKSLKDLTKQNVIEVVDVVYDADYNGEYVYYFVASDQIIIL